MKRLILILALCLIWNTKGNSQSIPLPQKWSNWIITSDYGPRSLPGYDFHEGIDYSAGVGDTDMGTPISSVESGYITNIVSRGDFYNIDVKGYEEGHNWLYGHIFSVSSSTTSMVTPEKDSNRVWELRLGAAHINIFDGKETKGNIVILWKDDTRTESIKIFSVIANSWIKINGNFLNTNDSLIVTSKHVSTLDDIAPMGNANPTPLYTHLHLGLNYPNDNPFLYLQHPLDTLATAVIEKPLDGHLFAPFELEDPNYPIKVRVESTDGYDVDKLTLWVRASDGRLHHLGKAGDPTFSYGGREDKERGGTKINVTQSNGSTTGIIPLDADLTKSDNQPGLDRFIFSQKFSDLNLLDGEHTLIADLRDVNGNQTLVESKFRIDSSSPVVSVQSISLYDNFSGTTTLNPSTLELNHNFVFNDAGSGISTVTITGPSDNLINWEFDPPVISTDVAFENMELGQYVVRAVDAVGNETIAPFRIGSLEISVSTPSSAIYDYTFHSTEENPYWIEYGCKIAINGVSSISLDRIELFEIVPSEADPRIIKSSQIAEVLSSTTVVFDLGISSSIYSYDSPDYLAKVWDTGGNAVQTIFNLRPDSQATSSSEGVYTNTYLSPHNNICLQADAREGNFTSNPIDIYSNENLIPGVVFPHIYKLPYGIIQNPFFVTWTNPKGDLPTLFNISIGDRQDIGDVELYLRTGDEEDVSDGEFIQIAKRHYFFADGENIPEENCSCSFQHPCICYTEQSYPNRVIPLKQYAQSKLVLKNPPPSSVVRQMCDPSDSEGMCPQGYEVSPEGSGSPAFDGTKVNPVYYYSIDPYMVSESNISVPLGSNVTIAFDQITTAGNIGMSIGYDLPPLGYVSLPKNNIFDINSNIEFDNAIITFAYELEGMSSLQESQIKIAKVIDSAQGLYEELSTTVDTINKKVSANITSFSRFIIIAPAYSTPNTIQSFETIAGNPEIEFISNEAIVSSEKIAESSLFNQKIVKWLKDNNKIPVGNMYFVGPDNTEFSPNAHVKMRYDETKLAALNVTENDLELYEFSVDSSLMFKVPRNILDTEKNEINAEVSKLHSLFAVLVSSQHIPSEDIMYPETTLSYSSAVFFKDAEVYISTGMMITLEGIDYPLKNQPAFTLYLKDISPDFNCLKTAYNPLDANGTCSNPIYQSIFSLTEGAHTVYYGSVDNAGNFENTKSTSIFVDGTAPVTTAEVRGEQIADGERVYITATDSVTLTAIDPVVNGVASGMYDISFLIDKTMEECEDIIEDDNAPQGTCENPGYTLPFTLSAGTHTVYYLSEDNVGNEEVKSVTIVVVEPSFSFDFNGIAQSPTSISWAWNLKENATAYQIFSSSGGAISPVLTESATYYIQANLIPNARYSNFLRAYGDTIDESSISEAVTFANLPEAIEVFDFGQNASLVIGQSDFATTSYGTASDKLGSPAALVFDKNGNLWISDRSNNRILRFPSPFSNGMSADLVIGHDNFYSKDYVRLSASITPYPSGMAFDAAGNLWVTMIGRILRFSLPFSNGMSADMVIGVENFYLYGGGCAQNKLNVGAWSEINFDKDDALWVADFDNNRVLRFSPPFSMGMNADMVIGQMDFITCRTGYPFFPSERNLKSPMDVEFDSEDNMWIADFSSNRVLKYIPPFFTGMSASLVLGQKNFTENNSITGLQEPNSSSLNGPASLKFDNYNNLYVADAYDDRVLKYRSPFSNGMDASLVLGQNDFNSTFNMNMQASFNLPVGVEASGFVTSDAQGRLWVADTLNNRVLMFEPVRAGIFTNIGISSFTVNWLVNNNSAETIYVAEISPYKDFSAQVINSGYTNQDNFTFTGLNSKTIYYARVKAIGLEGIETVYTNLGYDTTLKTPKIIVSTITINGNPEVSFSAFIEPTLVYLSTVSEVGTIVLSTAAEQGLTLASNLYEIGPEGIYEPPASLTFYYSTTTLADLGLLEEDIAIYEYFTDIGWVKLDNQVFDFNNNRITVPITQIVSIFGVFGLVKDRTASITILEVIGDRYQAAGGNTYINGKSSISLTVYEPVVYGTSTGVAYSEYRVEYSSGFGSGDSGLEGILISSGTYSEPINLVDDGKYLISYYSVDNAGNIEIAKSTTIYVDGTAPITEYRVSRLWRDGEGVGESGEERTYINAGSSIVLTAIDPISNGVSS
ncbi:MAG: hypothetical protein L6420_02195, partial [Elusimicrobia bacterium]|nr:hypothetical protein [Elusimicrobiota bacterium]